MASKVLRDDRNATVQPMVWPAAAPGGTHAPAPAKAPAAPDLAAQAARQMAELRAQAERQVREAREAGFREGEAAGRRAAEADLQPVLERLTRSIEEIAGLKPTLAAQAEEGLLKLAVAVARRILHREISLDPDALAGIVRAALERVQIDEVCRVRAHPADAEMLRASLEISTLPRSFAVEADAALERGAILLDIGRGKLDASVETQLAEIERGLADRLRRHL
jgi:flagellar assembly protein FliH